MSRRQNTTEEDGPQLMLGNLRDQHRVGFGYTDKDGLKCLVADVHLRLIGKSYNTELNIRGHVWAAKYGGIEIVRGDR